MAMKKVKAPRVSLYNEVILFYSLEISGIKDNEFKKLRDTKHKTARTLTKRIHYQSPF